MRHLAQRYLIMLESSLIYLNFFKGLSQDALWQLGCSYLDGGSDLKR